MNSVYPDAEFRVSDVESALECYDERYCTFPINEIVKLSGITFQKNKRNFRKQSVHLKGARAIQAINDEANETDWRSNNGRKSQAEKVIRWRSENPEGIKADCIRETGLSKSTVYRHWNEVKKG
jgi:hypothetical protein